jgi:hypothetical protein
VKVTDAVRSATIRRCSPNVGVGFVDPFARMRRRDRDASVSELGLPCPEQVEVLSPDIVVMDLSTGMNGLVATARRTRAAQCGDRSETLDASHIARVYRGT